MGSNIVAGRVGSSRADPRGRNPHDDAEGVVPTTPSQGNMREIGVVRSRHRWRRLRVRRGPRGDVGSGPSVPSAHRPRTSNRAAGQPPSQPVAWSASAWRSLAQVRPQIGADGRPIGRTDSRTPAGPCDHARGCGSTAARASRSDADARPGASPADTREAGLSSTGSAQQKRRKVELIAPVLGAAVALKLHSGRPACGALGSPADRAGMDDRAGQSPSAEVASAAAAGAWNANIDDCAAIPVHDVCELALRHVTVVQDRPTREGGGT
jgi:hypothetical protein